MRNADVNDAIVRQRRVGRLRDLAWMVFTVFVFATIAAWWDLRGAALLGWPLFMLTVAWALLCTAVAVHLFRVALRLNALYKDPARLLRGEGDGNRLDPSLWHLFVPFSAWWD